MGGRFLFFLSAGIATFIGLSAGAVTTSQDVDIIITHGAPLTTFTFVNRSGNTLPAGSPVSFGQGFRYGDIMPGTYPLIRDAATHVALPGQQWDEISTWRENGGNGSWRHAVWAAWLPKALAPGATYQIEVVAASGTYPQSSRQRLSALCSGPAAHDLKIHLTDVRNQNDTVRDSGDATFRLCDNIANVGRDAPRHLRAGNVYDEYVVSGMFVYATSGHKDPLLYAQCNVDIFTKASDGVSPGDIRWVCHMHNSWENVAAGITGNAGNPGPAGFANDPQAISYRPEVDDGASDVLDWSGLDTVVDSSTTPVSGGYPGGAHCHSRQGTEPACVYVASSTGANAWYAGQATRITCSATCVAGLTSGSLYYVWPAGTATYYDPSAAQYVSLMSNPSVDALYYQHLPWPMTTAQGTGTTTFSTRVQHYHTQAWQTLDASGQDNWSPFGTTTRVTRKVYPKLTAAEERYWQGTGLVIPVNVAQPPMDDLAYVGWQFGDSPNYEPFGKMRVIGGSGGGSRPDLGIVGEFASKAFITQAEADWDNARLFTFPTSMHGASTLLNEATGRIPAVNNGPPTGPGGNGNGGSYAGLGAPQNQLFWGPGGPTAMANWFGKPGPTPNAGDISSGTFYGGTSIDHMPAFDGITYMIFGDRHFLDMMQWHGNRDYLQAQLGPGSEAGQGHYRDNFGVFAGNGNTYHYYGLMLACYQGRGCTWLMRDVTYPATFGADPTATYPDGVTQNIERSYFHDLLKETSNYYPILEKFYNGPGSAAYSTSVWTTPNVDALNNTEVKGIYTDTFLMGYSFSVDYIMETFLHEPLASTWNTRFQRYYEGVCGRQLPNAPVSFGCINFSMQPHVRDGSGAGVTAAGGNQGPALDGTDAAEVGQWARNSTIYSGGQAGIDVGNYYTVTPGDTVKFMYGFGLNIGSIDQLPGDRWFTILGPVDNNAGTFYIQCTAADHSAFPAQCPVAGQAFTGFTRGGAPVVNETGQYPKYRFSYDPGPGAGYINNNYTKYAGQTMNGLKILGYNVTNGLADWNTRANPPTNFYTTSEPSFWWDPSIVVPGLPAAVNGIP